MPHAVLAFVIVIVCVRLAVLVHWMEGRRSYLATQVEVRLRAERAVGVGAAAGVQSHALNGLPVLQQIVPCVQDGLHYWPQT